MASSLLSELLRPSSSFCIAWSTAFSSRHIVASTRSSAVLRRTVACGKSKFHPTRRFKRFYLFLRHKQLELPNPCVRSIQLVAQA